MSVKKNKRGGQKIMWIKTIDENYEYNSMYLNMDSGMFFVLALDNSVLYLSFGCKGEKTEAQTIYKSTNSEEICNIYKALIKNVDELLNDGVSFMDFQGMIEYIQSHKA